MVRDEGNLIRLLGIYADIALVTLILALFLPYIKENTILLSILLVVSALRSVGTGVQTPAVSAVIPELVPEDQYMRINGINATIQSVVQFAAPEMQGRVFGFFYAIYSAFLPIGMIVFGPLSDVFSMRWIMVFSGIALIGLGMYTSRANKNKS